MLLNNSSSGTVALLVRLFNLISRQRRRQFFFLIGLTVLSSTAEVISLGAVFPFLSIITQPEKVYTSEAFSGIVQFLGITSSNELVFPFAIAFALAALLAGGLRLLLLWASIRIGNATGADLAVDVYQRTLYQDYSVHVARSSSQIISSIAEKVSICTSLLISTVSVLTSFVLFVTILLTLLAMDPIVSILAGVGFGSVYGLIAWLAHKRLNHNSQCISEGHIQVIKALQEGLGAIRDVLLDGTQRLYCAVFQKSVIELRRAGGENTFINQGPRYVMEALGMALIAVFVIAIAHRPGGVAESLPILGILALGAQRLIPLMQLIYGNWSVVASSKVALTEVLALLDQPLPAHADQPEPTPLEFRSSICFSNVCYRYDKNTPWILDDVNFEITKGARVGLIGITGSGKSTAMDLLMGLLYPERGQVLVDGQPVTDEHRRAWQRAIAHVPQSIFLADSTIAENIAFGVSPDRIDLDLVRAAAKKACIAEFIESRPEGYTAYVGERGVRLSGGQRQRIGIARALYKDARVLIFDEATSALDNETESVLMATINTLGDGLTILMIAHRLTTLKDCTQIIEFENGRVKRTGSYQEIINSHPLHEEQHE